MTLPVERSRSRRPVTWRTLVGVLLLPAVIGGILVGALYNPTDRLENMTAAIVNDDKAVELNGQLVPLGRQLTGGLVKGADDQASNIDWVISNDEDAAAGLKDGTYTAVVTIPENFTAASLSTRPGETPEKATIDVATAPNARVVDGAITATLASTASSVFGTELSSQYLKNVFLGFTTLSDQLGSAASGAHQLADGAGQAATGANGLRDGLGQLSNGAGDLSTGLGQLATGVGSLSGGVGQLATGADQLADGTGKLAAGAGDLANGAGQLSGGLDGLAGGADKLSAGATSLANGTRDAASGVGKLATGADGIADGNRQLATQVGQIADAIPPGFEDTAKEVAAAAPKVNEALGTAAGDLERLADSCDPAKTPDLCTQLRAASDRANAELPNAQQTVTDIGKIAGQAAELPAGVRAIADANAKLADGAEGLASGARDAETGLNTIAGGIDGVAGGASDLGNGARQLGAGASQLGSGATQLADGAQAAAGGAGQLATGARTAADGAGQLVSGADSAAGGAAKLADGAQGAEDGAGQLADGVSQVASGTSSLASGLDSAVAQLPKYTDAQATTLADVVADPVSATGTSDSLFGAAAVPLLAMAVLWFGGLASFVAFQAVSARALTSRRPSALVALRGFAPAALVGAVQGLLVAGVVQVASKYDWGDWALFALVCVAAGVAFAAVHQALVALFGGAGRWIAAIVGSLALAATIVSTVPPVLAGIASLLPTSPAYDAMLGALSSAGGVGAGVAGLAVWGVLALIVTTLVVVRRRTTSARAAAVLAAA
ncbi:YhgE/Pip domain-containing protein [Microbacterium sp. NPDC086615]|uniref:YhgE/Pip domain-containing protein n=1 Tax=Microbacterium sp. NPDC086615 TaxID=3154865 RepID=UPI00341F816F